MEICRYGLFLFSLGIVTTSESTVHPVTVMLNSTAVLPCSEKCSGVAKWTVFSKPKDPLVQCNQTSCRSVKEGYQMIHNQYLQGDLSLIISEADYSKKARYTCDCDGRDKCHVNLRIEPFKTLVQVQPGKPLLLKLDVSDPVKVIYNSSGEAGPSSGEICIVDGRSLRCSPEYSKRASLSSAVELSDVTPSDSGVYTVMDSLNEDAIHIYTVAVTECPTCDCPAAGVPVWMVVLLVGALALLVIAVVLIVMLKREIKALRAGSQNDGTKYKQNDGQINVPELKKLNL